MYRGGSKPRIWDAAAEVEARRLYLDALAEPAAIGAALGVTARQVRAVVARRGWSKLRDPEAATAQRRRLARARSAERSARLAAGLPRGERPVVVVAGSFWTDARVALAQQMRGQGASRRDIATALGEGCTPRMVEGLVARRCWPRIAQPAKRDALPKVKAARATPAKAVSPAKARLPAPCLPALSLVRTVVDDRSLIAAAVAAGRVQVLPPGTACGLSAIERQLWAATAPRPEDPRATAARSRRAARATALSRAGAGGRR